MEFAAAYASSLGQVRTFLNEGVLVNRAFLGNRAGRGNTTIGDVAGFLMEEEQLPPSAAKAIAGIVAGRLAEQSLEASSVTQEMVDSAALMIIGREVKVEIERLGRYLAPRRYLERRTVSGSAAADQLRSWLEHERAALSGGSQWTSPSERIANEIGTLSDELE